MIRRVFALLCAVFLFAAPVLVRAHNLPYSLVQLEVDRSGAYRIALQCHVAALITGLPQAHLSPDARTQFSRLSDAEIKARSEVSADYVRKAMVIDGDGRALPTPPPVFPSVAAIRADAAQTSISAAPSAPIIIEGKLPLGARTLRLLFPEPLGTVLIQPRLSGQTQSPLALAPGEASPPLTVDVEGRTGLSGLFLTVMEYVKLGFEHIVPEGFDHILFVLSLFLLTPRWKPLALQVTAFTLAHSVTLSLAVFGLIHLPSRLIETAIALSIAVVAIDNLASTRLARWRPVVVFGFGLLHGMGFAGVLRDLGLPKGSEALALASFNIGIELGQIAVLLAAFLAIGWFRRRPWYRSRLAVPLSLVIAATGLFWAVQRAFF